LVAAVAHPIAASIIIAKQLSMFRFSSVNQR
jgi:hypothetical protein